MSDFKIIIIGGGLAGALLANGLVNNGIECAVYEKDERGSTREGYQIRLGAAALTGFRACLTAEQQAGLLRKFGRSGGLIPSAPIMYDEKLVSQLDLTKFAAYTKSAPINRVVLRNYLQAPLDKAGVLHYEKKFVKYEILQVEGQTDRVRVEFADGSTADANLLISAEGSFSKINSQIGLNNIVQLRKRWGFLAKGDLPMKKLQTLTPLIQKAPMFCSVGGPILFASAYLPEASDSTSKAEYDESSASLFWGLSVASELLPPEGAKAIPDKLQFCIDITKHWDPRYHDIMRALDGDDIYVFQGRASTDPPKGWRKKAKVAEDPGRGHDRVWLMGDAIHPMLPSRGMGGNQSLQDTADAIEAIKLLKLSSRKDAPSNKELEEAVTQYEAKMIPRAFAWVKTSGGLGGMGPPDPSTLKGKFTIYLITIALTIVGAFGAVRRAFGYKPVDDAPELN